MVELPCRAHRPRLRGIAGVGLHDMDDLQHVVARNTSGREAEARRAGRIRRRARAFRQWLGSLEVVPTISALRERGDEIVREVLRENEGRWECLERAVAAARGHGAGDCVPASSTSRRCG